MSYNIILPKPVQKQLTKLAPDISSKVITKISELTENPRPTGVKKLKGFENEYLVRIGDYRIRYEIDEQQKTVIILSCRHRRNVYQN